MSYVVAFNRDRDFYQVPLALDEQGLLARLVTDLYLPDRGPLRFLMQRLGLGHRRVGGLSSRRVRWSLPTVAWQLLGRRFPVLVPDIWTRVGDALALAALDEAQARDAHLFLYSGSAAAAFRDRRADGRVKGLFVFHPLSGLIDSIVDEDLAAHPECRWSVDNATDAHLSPSRRQADDAEWRRADFIVAASNFTKRSLVHAGCDAARIAVVPYGAFLHNRPPTGQGPERPPAAECRFLFVGQGLQRKGLHHLLKVWAAARPPSSHLKIISYVMDPGIAALVPEDVQVLGRQPRAAVDAAFSDADVFVMPSLVEGFGLVYLEALAAGCFCIGSTHSGFPDLDVPDWAGMAVAPGDLSALAAAMARARDMKASGELDRDRIRAFAGTLTWERFRSGVASVARAHLPAGSGGVP